MTEIVAEISGNHGGSIDNAVRLIQAAKEAGADAVKFQCFEPERLAAKRASVPYVEKLAGVRSLLELYREVHTPKSWFPSLIAVAKFANIPWFSSVFDPEDVAFLETLDCPRYKISAFEMLDGNLINAVVATGKPIVMSVRSTATATVLLASEYGESSGPMFGHSDHSEHGILSIGLMVERHIRLPDVETPDTKFSSTPDEFRNYVKRIRELER